MPHIYIYLGFGRGRFIVPEDVVPDPDALEDADPDRDALEAVDPEPGAGDVVDPEPGAGDVVDPEPDALPAEPLPLQVLPFSFRWF